jgi:hypothetical protein
MHLLSWHTLYGLLQDWFFGYIGSSFVLYVYEMNRRRFIPSDAAASNAGEIRRGVASFAAWVGAVFVLLGFLEDCFTELTSTPAPGAGPLVFLFAVDLLAILGPLYLLSRLTGNKGLPLEPMQSAVIVLTVMIPFTAICALPIFYFIAREHWHF